MRGKERVANVLLTRRHERRVEVGRWERIWARSSGGRVSIAVYEGNGIVKWKEERDMTTSLTSYFR